MRFIEKLKNGEIKSPERAIRLINSICQNLGEQYREELTRYIKMDDAILDQEKDKQEHKKEDKEADKQEDKEGKGGITPKDIEARTEGANLEEIRGETEVIREGIENTPDKTIEEVGEETDDRTID